MPGVVKDKRAVITLTLRVWRLWRSNRRLFLRRLAMVLRAPRRNVAAIVATRRRYQRIDLAYQRWLACPGHRDGGAPDGPHDSPLLSVIMPVYNGEAPVLEAAIESVLGQTYRNWELCVAEIG